MTDYTIRIGKDTTLPIRIILEKEGNKVSLFRAHHVELYGYNDDGTIAFSGLCEIDDMENGIIIFDPQPEDTNQYGFFKMWIKVCYNVDYNEWYPTNGELWLHIM